MYFLTVLLMVALVWFWFQAPRAWREILDGIFVEIFDGLFVKIKILESTSGWVSFLKEAWSFAVERFWNYNETFIWYYYDKFGILIHYLSQPFEVVCKYFILYCNTLQTPLKRSPYIFSLYILKLVRKGRFSWNPCTVVGNIQWSRTWKKYSGLTKVFCCIRHLCSMKLGYWFSTTE